MLLSQIESVVVLVMAGIFLIFALIALVTIGKVFTLWLQSLLAGVPISVFQIVGMRLRKVDVRVVVRSLIMATQAGVPVPNIEMERAYLQGGGQKGTGVNSRLRPPSPFYFRPSC